MSDFDIVVVGSGAAGTILARVLRRLGRRVALVERGSHPRFALGESSTPLAGFTLERLAARYDLPDLHHLATWGRWTEHLPHLRRGLKRGFTFYRHHPGRPYANGPENDARLLVAASPSDRIADAHWLRSDVDHHLWERAGDEGVELLDRTELAEIELRPGGVTLHGRSQGRAVRLGASRVVDATGPGGFLARHLPIPAEPAGFPLRTGLVFAHLDSGGYGVKTPGVDRGARDGSREVGDSRARSAGTSIARRELRPDSPTPGTRREPRQSPGPIRVLADFPALARSVGATMEPGPYPDERAAVHHLLDEGWLYVLPFDHGVASVGLVLRDGAALETEPPEAVFRRVVERYPTLAEQLRVAPAVVPWSARHPLPYRLRHAAGPTWAVLPHTFAFADPMFSTGLAWSLLAVERLAPMLVERADLTSYDATLRREADQIDRLVTAAYAAFADPTPAGFDRFVAVTSLYFATVSFEESRLRLASDDHLDARPVAFLGADDPTLVDLFREALRRLRARDPDHPEDFRAWVEHEIAPHDVVGLDAPPRPNLFPADLDVLVERAGRLGMSPDAVRRALPRLRG